MFFANAPTRILTHLYATCLILGAILFACLGRAAASDSADLIDVRFGVSENGRTRIVMDLTADVKYRIEADQGDDTQKKILVDMANLGILIGPERVTEGQGRGIGHVASYHYDIDHEKRASLVFDLKDTATPVSVFMIKPKEDATHHRLVVDLEEATEAEFTASLGKVFGKLKKRKQQTEQKVLAQNPVMSLDPVLNNMATPVSATPAQVAQHLLEAKRIPIPRQKPVIDKIKIVLDPGHGGKDPGAVGQNGTYEKKITLASAITLKKILTKRGYEVILTRSNDTYPELEERIQKAREVQADLFLSIHADAVDAPHIRGASVYTLSDKGSVRLANEAQQNGDFHIYETDLAEFDEDISYMLFDIHSRESRNRSSVLANHMIQHLSGKVKMVNNTHREANYVVLLSPDVPAVLLELAFMSNVDDEANLNSATWRQTTLTTVANAIDEYFEKRRPMRQAMSAGGAQ